MQAIQFGNKKNYTGPQLTRSPLLPSDVTQNILDIFSKARLEPNTLDSLKDILGPKLQREFFAALKVIYNNSQSTPELSKRNVKILLVKTLTNKSFADIAREHNVERSRVSTIFKNWHC
ncbi:MAG: hypothetical protein VKJ06_08960 [Vampirovibrionales bacterium]|nr:hypothetical protein [Vampirovibrionales bacterium]